MVTMIAAVDLENGIGRDGDLLFYLEKDMAFFKEKTIGNTVVMGRKTQESLPKKKLKNRTNIVLTSNPIESNDEDIMYTDNILDVIHESDCGENIYIIGGEQIYNEFIHHADELLITRILAVGDADRFFPKITSEFELVEESPIFIENDIEFYFEKYERAN